MNDLKKSIRPIIPNIDSIADKKEVEKFQNVTLRPIIKLQHELLVAFYENYMLRKRIKYAELSPTKKKELIFNTFKNDTSFKTELRGLIIGHFTPDEYASYLTFSNDANKRIITMIRERLLSVT
jgi:hypothetical protein